MSKPIEMSDQELFKNFVLLIKEKNIEDTVYKMHVVWNDYYGVQLTSNEYALNAEIFYKYFKKNKYGGYNYDFLSDDNLYQVSLGIDKINSNVYVNFRISPNDRLHYECDEQLYEEYREKSHCLRNMIKTFDIDYKDIDISPFEENKKQVERTLTAMNFAVRNMNLEFV